MPDPAVSLAVGLALVAAAAGAPVLMARRRVRRRPERERLEDGLKYLYQRAGAAAPFRLAEMSGALGLDLEAGEEVLERLMARGLAAWATDGPQLTPAGADYAAHIVRAHRLYEAYLAERTGFAEARWHALADRYEHTATPEEVQQLSARLGDPRFDPHGDPIPAGAGAPEPPAGVALTEAPLGEALRVAPLEDEPAGIYQRLVEKGLRPGVALEIARRDADALTLRTEHGRVDLAAPLAANVTVAPAAEAPPAWGPAEPGRRLSALAPGEQARIVCLHRSCRGAERRRLLDLGLTPGTLVGTELRRSGGHTAAYRVRGALVALRREQAHHIEIEPVSA